MNNHKKIVPFFKLKEGGLSRDLNDSAKKDPCPTTYNGKMGWHTNKGITYTAWKGVFGTNNDDRFFTMNDEDWGLIFKSKYWDAVKGDKVPGQSIAEVLVSWAWGSGAKTAVKQMQRLLNQMGGKLLQDGDLGKLTMAEIKKHPEVVLFDRACETRESFFRFISDENNGRTPAERLRFKNNAKNLQGWLNRLSAFKKTFRPV